MIPTAVAAFPVYDSPRVHHEGVCSSHLQTLSQARQSEELTENPPQLRMALVNARSVVNKTVIINFSLRRSWIFFLVITESSWSW